MQEVCPPLIVIFGCMLSALVRQLDVGVTHCAHLILADADIGPTNTAHSGRLLYGGRHLFMSAGTDVDVRVAEMDDSETEGVALFLDNRFGAGDACGA